MMDVFEFDGRLIEVIEFADNDPDTEMSYEVSDITVGDNRGQLFTLTDWGDRVLLELHQKSVDLAVLLYVARKYDLPTTV
ncbi:hypothetical protein ACFCV3_20670 [Kribbella sp. NPDC056345]|uniref:hypothetical protein n=1 Tax=Kribbella sp. NPDC056345 TaxID=3345789 RepID=UPI0035D84718